MTAYHMLFSKNQQNRLKSSAFEFYFSKCVRYMYMFSGNISYVCNTERKSAVIAYLCCTDHVFSYEVSLTNTSLYSLPYSLSFPFSHTFVPNRLSCGIFMKYHDFHQMTKSLYYNIYIYVLLICIAENIRQFLL